MPESTNSSEWLRSSVRGYLRRPLMLLLSLLAATCSPAKAPESPAAEPGLPAPAADDPSGVSCGQSPEKLISSLSPKGEEAENGARGGRGSEGRGAKSAQAAKPSPEGAGAVEASAPAAPSQSGEARRITAVEQFEKVNLKPDHKSPVIGLLRAGQSVRVKGEGPLRGPGVAPCPAGWYAIEPRGYVCPGVRSSLAAPNLRARAAAEALPDGSSALGYRVGTSIGAPVYLRIPTPAEQRSAEPGLDEHLARAYPPDDAAGGSIDRTPAGSPPSEVLARYFEQVKGPLVDKVGAFEGRKVAWTRELDAEGRTWLLTPDLGLIPKDKVRVKPVPALAGVDLRDDSKLPLAFLWLGDSPKHRDDASGVLRPSGEVWPRHSYVPVTGEVVRRKSGMFLKARDGTYLKRDAATVIQAGARRPSGVGPGDKWVSVRVTHGYLVAYEGDTPVYTTAISPGIAGVNRRGNATHPGLYNVVWKFRSWRMSGVERRKEWVVDEVPFVAFYKGNFALHGAWWHNDFGRPKSHGCVNIAPAAAQALFSWLAPDVPEGWYAVASYYPEVRGTMIEIRP